MLKHMCILPIKLYFIKILKTWTTDKSGTIWAGYDNGKEF